MDYNQLIPNGIINVGYTPLISIQQSGRLQSAHYNPTVCGLQLVNWCTIQSSLHYFQMPPTNLSKAQVDDLRELWETGLTSLGDKGKISEAMEATGLAEKTIKVCWSS